jgi:hypothetical protein
MRSISLSERPEELSMRIFCSLPVPRSFARDVHDAVRDDIEGNLDLRHAARRGRTADEVELSERAVLARHLALALEDLDNTAFCPSAAVENTWLLRVGMVCLRLMRRVKQPPNRLDPTKAG